MRGHTEGVKRLTSPQTGAVADMERKVSAGVGGVLAGSPQRLVIGLLWGSSGKKEIGQACGNKFACVFWAGRKGRRGKIGSFATLFKGAPAGTGFAAGMPFGRFHQG